jgi:hypothetical protein
MDGVTISEVRSTEYFVCPSHDAVEDDRPEVSMEVWEWPGR